ncbi:sigma-54-dependent transcriptional regulator [Epibacterium ulvae]|uniref:sigma-54-dependent transcriptional regulator n=1 Tax=Epibacterium ulvae TaxID=1156985 RepID=UPI0024903EA0|nr:sigma-54 dependent transcriptional regulator [Epibacterium ulvae]
MKVLIIDDEIKLTQSLSFALKHADIDCIEAHDGFTGCQLVANKSPDIVLLDVRMPGRSGLEVLEWLAEAHSEIPVIMMSALDDTKDAVTAMKMGAIDYISKPFDVDELIQLLHKTNRQHQEETDLKSLNTRYTSDTTFIGNSLIIRNLRSKIDRVVEAKANNILLTGETGVGKGVVARQLHIKSFGEDAPFVEINCATLPERQIEAELFGANKGAIPGAVTRHRGFVEIASGGTLFLNEISEMPLSVQTRLLSFLETRTYRPVGSVREYQSDIRVVAATNTKLEEAVAQKVFREDLYFRLNQIPIEIPPLRDREGDIETLALYFAQAIKENGSARLLSFDKSALDVLRDYDWPGNVRELRNLVERLAILKQGGVINAAQLPTEVRNPKTSTPVTIVEAMDDVERGLIEDALLKSGGRKAFAAERLGISRHALKRKMQRLGLS